MKKRSEPKVIRQEVHWIPVPESRCIPLNEHPYRVWTLYGPGMNDPKVPPILPISPVHNRGAFLEDFLHDWTFKSNQFRYASRVTNEGTWVLIEYADNNPFVKS